VAGGTYSKREGNVMEDEHLNRYAELVVKHAAGLQPGQTLFVHARLAYRDFALRIGEAAYKAGARYVSYLYCDPLVPAQLIRHGGSEQIALYALQTQAWYDEIVRTGDAVILLDGVDRAGFSDDMARTHARSYSLLMDATHATYLLRRSKATRHRSFDLGRFWAGGGLPRRGCIPQPRVGGA
jgi:leucyl aminopeptidase (aminopeptidase T)